MPLKLDIEEEFEVSPSEDPENANADSQAPVKRKIVIPHSDLDKFVVEGRTGKEIGA